MEMKLQEYSLEHPDGKIILMNGSAIEGFPKSNSRLVRKNSELQFDTTGVFFRTRHSKKSFKPEKEDSIIRHRELFSRLAFKLYERKDIIYLDSRMFLTPVDMGCNLAYTGESGLSGATLGVWLEWWDALGQCRIDKNGNARLVISFAGSPLNGSNVCNAVTPDGNEMECSITPFSILWSTFMKINGRYYEPRQIYECYSLEEVVEKLHLAN